ncbi:MAG: ATP-dependent sacrificial sulfur transferase LarE [Clostridiales Family XIII bacterium]|nr:ATP-dependent sacrificial sulfur transferase LarE [Clostridiales Family XIII bacterium]
MTKTNYERLLAVIRPYEKAVVAFSGGVDSTLLALASVEALGRDNLLCVTARSASFPERELKAAADFCAAHGIAHQICDSEELDIDGFAKNPLNRCYLCKHELFLKITEIASAFGAKAVFEGSNVDDEGDYRPGMQAVSELGVKSPLREAGLPKDEIRRISRALGLGTWDKQSFACLSSRFVYGEDITIERLHMVDRAEQWLLDRAFRFVRVRIHGNENPIARIEVLPEEIERLTAPDIRAQLVSEFKQIGFSYITLDLVGYRTGSMNEGVNP